MNFTVDLSGYLAAVLHQPHVIRLQRDDVRPLAPVANHAEKPLILDALVKSGWEALDRLISPCIDLPVIDFLAQIDAEAFECISGIAPFVAADQAPIQCFIGHPACTKPDRAMLFLIIFAQRTFKLQFGICLDQLEFIEIAIIMWEIAVVAP